MVMTLSREGDLVPTTQANIIPKERYVSQEFFDLEMERLWPRVWQMACREEEVPQCGRLPRVHHRRPVDPGHPERPRHHPGLLQHLPAPGHPPGRRRGQLRHRGDPLPLPRLALRARRHQQRGGRPLRLPRLDDRRRGLLGPDQGRALGWLRLHQHGPRLRVPRVVPRPAPGPARPLRLRKDALSLLSHRHHPGQLEVRPRRLQRGLSRPRDPPPALALDRRHHHGLRPLGQAQPHGGRGQGQARDPPEPASGPWPGRLRRARAVGRHDRRARGPVPQRRAPKGLGPQEQPLARGQDGHGRLQRHPGPDAAGQGDRPRAT